MDRELLLKKIIEASGNEIELPLENECRYETFETLMKMQDGGIIRLEQFINHGDSINLKADFLSATPEPQTSIGQTTFERLKKILSTSLNELFEEIDRLNNKIIELEKKLAEK